jgi:hypothetical protein
MSIETVPRDRVMIPVTASRANASDQMIQEPPRRQPRDFNERTWLLKQVRRARNDLKVTPTRQTIERLPI